MIQMLSIFGLVLSDVMADFNDEHRRSAFSGTEESELLKITLNRPASGAYLGGIDSQVLRPITTAFTLPGSTVVEVILLK